MLRRSNERARPVNPVATNALIAEVVVSFRGTIVDVAHVGHLAPSYSVGEGPEASFKIGGAALPDPAATTLVERVGDRYMLTVPPRFDAQVELIEGAGVTVEHGEVRFDIRLVPREAVATGRAPLDRPFWASVIGNASLATMAFLLMRAMPPDAMAIALDDEADAARFASYFEQADEARELEPSEAEPATTASPAGAQADRRTNTNTRAGRRANANANTSSSALPLRGPRGGAPGLRRDSDLHASAQSAGILGILAAQDQSFLASAEGAFGSSEADALLWANASGLSGHGVAGLELTGGTRVGGTASELAGLGATGLLGHGTGSDGRLIYGGEARHGDRQKRAPVAVLRDPTTTNNVDKDVIRRIVRSHLMEIRGCYNAGLTRNPNLEGRVTVQFSILTSGKVASAVIEQNTTRDAGLGDCITKAVKRWKFPTVQGGAALVSYPFQLRAR